MKAIVIGGGLRGCMAAKAARRAGYDVTVLEVRQTLGCEITAAGQEFLACGESEITVMLGSVAKSLLNTQLSLGNRVLFNTRAGGLALCGNRAAGVLTANGYGTQLLSADLVIDTEETLLSAYEGQQGIFSYIFCIENVAPVYLPQQAAVPHLGLQGDRVTLHGSVQPDRVLVEIRYEKPLAGDAFYQPQREAPAAMRLAEKVFLFLKENHESFQQAVLGGHFHNEVRLLGAAPRPRQGIEGYVCLKAALPDPLSAFALEQMEEAIREEVGALCKETQPAAAADSILMRHGKIALSKCTLYENKAVAFRDGFLMQGIHLPLDRIPCREKTGVLVAGAGTAGLQTMEALCQEQAPCALVELCALTGGTRMLGMVTAYWHGYKGGRNAARDEADKLVREGLPAHNIPAAMLAESHMLSPIEEHFYLQTAVCGAEMEEKRVKALLCCDGGGLFRIEAQAVVDATGDGVAAYLAGAEYAYGDPRDGSVQTCSLWGKDHWKKNSFLDSRVTGDHDMLDIDSYEDVLRSICLGQHDASNLGYAPLLTVRESRRIVGDYELTMDDVWDETIFEDTLSVTQTPFDTHGKPSTAYFDMRLGRPKELKARIPYRCYLVKHLSNMLITAKAYSGTRDANGIGRMNADLRHGGYAVGLAAAQAVKENKALRAVDIGKVQQQLLKEGCLPEWTFEPLVWEDVHTLYEKAKEVDTQALLYLYRTEKEKDLAFLREKWETEKETDLALCMAAWHEFPGAVEAAARRISQMMEQVNDKGFMADYDVALHLTAALSHAEKAAPEWLLPLIEKAQAGGDVYYPEEHKYYKKIYGFNRVDTWKVPHYHLLYHLAFAAARNAHEMLAEPLEKLLKKKYLGGYAMEKGNAKNAPFLCHGVTPVMCALLEAHLAAAAARCGSEEGKAVLARYGEDDRSILRKFAKKELAACPGGVCPLQEKVTTK